jgi:hypothetical protein
MAEFSRDKADALPSKHRSSAFDSATLAGNS